MPMSGVGPPCVVAPLPLIRPKLLFGLPMPERIGMPVICRGLVGVRPPGTATDTA